MSNPSPKPSTAQPPARTPGKDASAGAARAHDEDELHVPRGVSKRTFYFLIGLLILLMVIWLVPGALSSIASGSGNPIVARFRLPDGTQVEWKASEVTFAQRALQDGMMMSPWLAARLGVSLQNTQRGELTRVLVLDRLAVASGVEVTDAQLAAHLKERVGMFGQTSDDFKAEVRARGFDQVKVEEGIRQLLRAQRFVQMIGFAGAVPTPAKIEELWKGDNEEFAFDYATLAVAELKEAARAALPDDAGLEAWFAKLTEGEKAEFKSPEKRTAEVALFRDSETTPASELIAAYPESVPEGATATTPDELANQYYNRVYATRFAKDPTEVSTSEGFAGFFSFEEVKEVCLAEAPVFFAMQRWIDDLNARRTNGETLDFAGEAAKFGLELQTFPEAQTREELGALEDLDGVDDAVFGTPPDGSLYSVPVALSPGLAVVRVNSRTEPELPAFAAIRERVVEKWLGPKAEELALERLKDLRKGLERFESAEEEPAAARGKKPEHYRATAEAFRAALGGAGLAPKERGFLNKATPRDQWPSEPEALVLLNQARAMGLYGLEADEVAEPALSSDRTEVYLVRLAGKREVPIANMSPAQYESYKSRARDATIDEIAKACDLDFLRQTFGLWLIEDEAAKDTAPAAKSG